MYFGDLFLKQCAFDVSVDRHSTISFALDLYHHYHRQYKVNGIFIMLSGKDCVSQTMLLRRLKSLHQLQNCRTQLEKATKPQKKEAVSSSFHCADNKAVGVMLEI